MSTHWAVFPEEQRAAEVRRRRSRSRSSATAAVSSAIYREPLGDALAASSCLPLAKVEPTPYQRDLSKPHVKRLQEVIRSSAGSSTRSSWCRPAPGRYWTPNGNHRRESLHEAEGGLDPRHRSSRSPRSPTRSSRSTPRRRTTVKEKSLEVIRMYRGLVGGGLEGDRGGLRLPVRGPALHHARAALRRASPASPAAPSRRSSAASTSS